MPNHKIAVAVLLAIATAFSLMTPANATVYTQDQITGFFQNSSNSYLQQNAAQFAAMSANVEDTTRDSTVYNGSCCTGMMQINTSNLANPDICGCTPAEFAAMSGQQQIDVYTRYFDGVQSDASIQKLEQMQASGQTLGGQVVTGDTVVACAQLGTANCAAAIANNCSSVANGQGGDGSVNVCTMAAKATSGSSDSSSTGSSSSTSSSASSTSLSSNDKIANSTGNASDYYCWSCTAINGAFNTMDAMISQMAISGDGPGFSMSNLLKFFAIVFATVLVFQVGRNIVFWYLHYQPPHDILAMSMRFVVVMTILQGGSLYPNWIQPYLVDPAIGAGGQIGAQIGGYVANALGVSNVGSYNP